MEKEFWNLYIGEGDRLDVQGHSPRLGRLVIDTLVVPTLPLPMHRCLVTFEDRALIRQWGNSRTFYIVESGTQEQRRERALAHLNGQE